MRPTEIIEQMKEELVELAKIDFGYPLGENVVHAADRPDGLPPVFSSIDGSRWLASLYCACDGLSFPDIHNGYFLKPLWRVISFDRSSEPDIVVLDREIRVLPFGSMGDGSLFVVQCEQGGVMLLPPGSLNDGRYDGRGTKVSEVATTVPHFLELLLADLTAFVNDDNQHTYLGER